MTSRQGNIKNKTKILSLWNYDILCLILIYFAIYLTSSWFSIAKLRVPLWRRSTQLKHQRTVWGLIWSTNCRQHPFCRTAESFLPPHQMQPTPTTGCKLEWESLQSYYFRHDTFNFISLFVRLSPIPRRSCVYIRELACENRSSFWHNYSLCAPTPRPMTRRRLCVCMCVSKTELIPGCNWIAPITLMQALSPANLLRAINDNTSLISARRHQSPSKMIKKQFPLHSAFCARC